MMKENRILGRVIMASGLGVCMVLMTMCSSGGGDNDSRFDMDNDGRDPPGPVDNDGDTVALTAKRDNDPGDPGTTDVDFDGDVNQDNDKKDADRSFDRDGDIFGDNDAGDAQHDLDFGDTDRDQPGLPGQKGTDDDAGDPSGFVDFDGGLVEDNDAGDDDRRFDNDGDIYGDNDANDLDHSYDAADGDAPGVD